jgi:hypothetical protein
MNFSKSSGIGFLAKAFELKGLKSKTLPKGISRIAVDTPSPPKPLTAPPKA